ncbi:MAG: LPS-assembly protein LptD [Marinilabiliaceae bacterium]|nr:LPS-assembly protein LptD [Marinilabiliaceae bacterium]
MKLLFLLTIVFTSAIAKAQQPDTLSTVSSVDTLSTASESAPAKSFIVAEIKYTAKDSIIFSLDGQKVFLYQDAVVTYQDIELKAWFIEIDLERKEAYACGTVDTLGAEIGLPVYKDKQGEYTMRTMRYNFESKKALIEHVVTEQGEGFVVSDVAKKSDDNVFCLKGGMYTTCDHHDHPHFGLRLTKAKVIPGRKIITGPAYFVMEDVPIYFLFIPFGFVPSTSKYSSGIIMPSYGEESTRGFFLRNGGYYWAASDYFDFTVTGDVYMNGSWGLRTGSVYKNRYRYSGNFNAQYIKTITSEKDLPDYATSSDMSLTWSHRQDAKANPYRSVNASVNYSTSSFDRKNIANVVNTNLLAQNTKRSSISYTQRWPDNPFNLSVNLLHSQNSRDTSIDLTIPDLTLTMNRLTPFKSKNKVGGKEVWYEKISFSYSATTKNYISTKESDLFTSASNDDWKNGVKHAIPVSMNLKFLKYFVSSPSINYNERWYFQSIRKGWDADQQKVVTTDTISGFNRVWDYSYSIGTSTKLYTFYTPSRALFGDKINAIRHVMTPSVSMSYNPNFGEAKYGYYDWFEYYNPKSDEIVRHEYSKYEGSLYGSPGNSRSGSMSMSLGNTLEMKVKNDKDTTGFSKIKILESLNFSTGYNFLADSLKWQKVSMTGRTKIFKTDINFGASFDPYALDTNKLGAPIRINQSHLKVNHQLLRLESANLSFGFSWGSDKMKKKKEGEDDAQQPGEDEDIAPEMTAETDRFGQPLAQSELRMMERDQQKTVEYDADGYAQFSIPWNISLNYNMRLAQGAFNKTKMDYDKEIVSDVSFNGSISPTSKWAISFSSGYSFDKKQLSHTSFNIRRNLHCWSMSLNLVPIGTYKSYFFTISANSSMLQDLKYEKQNANRADF